MNLNIHRDLNSQWTMGYAKERMLMSPVQAGHGVIRTADMDQTADQVHQRDIFTKIFTMGIKSPYEYDDQLLDQKMFDILEAR